MRILNTPKTNEYMYGMKKGLSQKNMSSEIQKERTTCAEVEGQGKKNENIRVILFGAAKQRNSATMITYISCLAHIY